MQVSEILEMKKGIKAKLMAATSLLLVSAILLSLTTYAWFILSTAPEVTEMQTTAGANGALEIALLNAQGAVDDGTVGRSNVLVSNQLANTTWGNLVDLSEGYGIENLTLYPSRLAINKDGESYSVARSTVLNYPEFGKDGRITELCGAEKASYNNTANSFEKIPDHYGVNVFGKILEENRKTVYLQYSRDSILKESTAKVKYYQQSLRERMVAAINDNAAGIFNLLMNASSLTGGTVTGNNNINWTEAYAATNDIVSKLYAMTGDEEDSLRWALLAYAASDTVRYNENNPESMKELGILYRTFRAMTLYTVDPDNESVYQLAVANKYDKLAEAVLALRQMKLCVENAMGYLKQGESGVALACISLINLQETKIMNGKDPATSEGTVVYATEGGFGYNLRNRIYYDEIFFLGKKQTNVNDDNKSNGAVFDNMTKIVGDFSAEITAYGESEGDRYKFVEKPTSESSSQKYKFKAFFTSETTKEGFSEYIKFTEDGHEYTAYSHQFETFYKDEQGNWYTLGGMKQVSNEIARKLNESMYTEGKTGEYGIEYKVSIYNEMLHKEKLHTVFFSSDGSWLTSSGKSATKTIPEDIRDGEKVQNTKKIYEEDGLSYLICKYGEDKYYVQSDDPDGFDWDGKAVWYERTSQRRILITDTDLINNLNQTAVEGHIGALGEVYQAALNLHATGNVPFEYTRSELMAYGYTVDFAFRSSQSGPLLLQSEVADRVQQGRTNSSTQGGGSYVSFTIAGDMSTEDAENLIRSIQIVFMDTSTGGIYKIAAVTDVTMELNKATARFDLFEPQYEVSRDGMHYVTCGQKDETGTITNLVAGAEVKITAVVYLNGDTVTSEGFSATQGVSLDGTVNLQFATESDLRPMEYTDYQIKFDEYRFDGKVYYYGSDGKWYDADKKQVGDDDLTKKLDSLKSTATERP